jgi:CheY-like chemotaxis protein
MYEQQKVILCVEDDEDDSLWIEEAISEIDPSIDVFVRNNGNEALKFLKACVAFGTLPCLILLDVNMPGMNGKETIAEIKRDLQFKDISVVVFTTSNSKKEELYFEKFGAEFLTKPKSYEDFKRKINQVVLARCN